MQYIGNKFFNVVLTLSVVLTSRASFGSAPKCHDLFERTQKSALAENFDKTKKLYAKGINSVKDPNGHFQISYESEYLFSESAVLLRDYAPEEKVLPKAKWLALSDQQRIDWIKQKFGNKPEHATAAGLRRIVDVDFLPEELIVDSTGNLEIVINPPVDTYAQWETIVDYIVGKYGAGSQQAMISKPREASFNNLDKKSGLEKQHLGWLHYTNLFDMFEKLDNGYQKFSKDQTKPSAQFFDHPFLGPMSKIKRDQLETYLFSNAKLKKYDDASKLFVRKSDASFKYTGGPSYRPDIAGPVRWAWEIRNAHKDLAGLKAKVIRDLNAHTEGLNSYERFSGIDAFDTVAEFSKFSDESQTALKEIFPSKADPRFEYNESEITSLETYRNFSMPMMNLNSLVEAFSPNASKAALKKIFAARSNYILSVEAIAKSLKQNKITKDFAKAQVMGALCTWAHESGLFELFKNQAKELGHDKENKNVFQRAG